MPILHVPIAVRTHTLEAAKRTAVFVCDQFVLVRDGAANLFQGGSVARVRAGMVIVVSARASYWVAPKPSLTTTTLYLDRDYLIDQVYWQSIAHFVDRHEVKAYFETDYTNRSQLLCLDPRQVAEISVWLDELEDLSRAGITPERFWRAQALFSSVLDTLLPQLSARDRQAAEWRRRLALAECTGAGLARSDERLPLALRREAHQALELLHSDLERRWKLKDLAASVHLSESQLGRLFVATVGMSPIAYLTVIRVEQMAHLLRTTDAPVSEVAARVGWGDAGFAARQFRRVLSVSPLKYRMMCLHRRGIVGLR